MTEEVVVTEPIVEKPAEMTVGEMLRNARTTGRRKREIPTIAKQLCIREEFLEALENGNYNAIPETVYVLGFARNYAMELGLEPDEIIAKIKKEMGLVADCAADDEDVTACAMPSIKDEEHWAKIMFVKCYQFIYQNWQWFAGALLAIVLTIVLIVVLTPSSDDVKLADDSVVAVTEVKSEKYNLPVVLQASQESWVKVEDGRGNTVFSRVLVPGDIYYVPAGDKYKATFGNAGGIDIWVNGKKAPDAGADHTRKSGISLAPKSLLATK